MTTVVDNEDNEFDNNKSTNLDSFTVNRNPISDKEVSNKTTADDSIGEGSILRFNWTIRNNLKFAVGNKIYHLPKHNKERFIDNTNIKFTNTGGYILYNWLNNVLIKLMIEKYEHLINEQKQVALRKTQELRACLLFVMVFCI